MKFSNMQYNRIHLEDIEPALKGFIAESKNAKSGEEQFAIHEKYYELKSKLETMIALSHIRHDSNTTDEYYAKEQDYYDEILPIIRNLDMEYSKQLYLSPFRPYLESKIGKVCFKNIELQLKSLDESLIPLMQEENALSTKYAKLIAGAQIPFHGDILNISLLRKYLVSNDRSVRKEAYAKLSEYFMSVTGVIDMIYDSLVANRTKQAVLMGYENYIPLGYYRMQRNCYDQPMVETFRQEVKTHIVPLAQKIYEKRKKRLGVERLTYIDDDIFSPEGNPTPIGTPEEILASGKAMYSELSPETKEFFTFMMDNELFDVLGRKNKRAGGYMDYIPNYKSPFIFANFNGTSGDVDVITHECGHAFQRFVVRDSKILEHIEITMETAEVHSMSMEFFTYQWMESFFGNKADDYRTMHLENSILFLPYGCMVDEFQHEVYANPNLTPDERKQLWQRLEKEYKPHLDYDLDPFFGAGGFWQKQQHIFTSPFYYIDYCLASVCALQYKVKIDENFEKAWKSYFELCKLSAKDFYVDMLLQVGLQNPFEKGSMENIAKQIEAKILV